MSDFVDRNMIISEINILNHLNIKVMKQSFFTVFVCICLATFSQMPSERYI